MRQALQASLVTALLLFSAACAARSPSTESPGPTANRDFILRDEIDRGQWANSFELIRNVRPQWLRVRGRDTITGDPGEVQVVLDNVRLGNIDALRALPVSGITYYQWLDGISASQLWGTGYGNGAILVSTRPR